MKRLAATLLRRALVLGLAFCTSIAGSNERDQPDASIDSETSELLARPGMQIHPDNALQVIRELAPGTSIQPSFSVQGEIESGRCFFRALSLDFERVGIPTPEPSEDFFNYKRT
ncbi:hypothetical protein N9H39_02975 [Gammaproteobacteria bacterium]|nr:hypothetical protein [Gammaproteobacteria bacterium]